MLIDTILEEYPRDLELADGFRCRLRPLESQDEAAFHQLFVAVPEKEKMFIKHRVNDSEVIRSWCRDIDLGRHLPMLAVADAQIVAASTLHQQLGGWKRHIGRVSVLVHPEYRGKGLAKALVKDVIEIANQLGLEKLEAEFMGEQERAIRMFGLLGFSPILRLQEYIKDMQATKHDYVLMGLDLETDIEYAGVG